MRHTAERIPDQVQTRKRFVERLARVKVHDATHLPVVENAPGPAGIGPSRPGNIVVQTDGEEMACIEVAVSVIRTLIKSIIQYGGTVLADLIQSMRPGVRELRAQAAPIPRPENSLQGIVV